VSGVLRFRIEVACPACGRVTRAEGTAGQWAIQDGCACFPSALRARLPALADREVERAGLAPCPSCGAPMPNACGARCLHCGFKLSCSAEP